MTTSLEQAISIAARLPDQEQDSIAAKIREEIERIEDAALWEQKIDASTDVLEMLYDEAMAEHSNGQAKPLNA